MLQLAEWTFAVVLSRVICGLVVSHLASHFARLMLYGVWELDQQDLLAHVHAALEGPDCLGVLTA